MQPTPEQKKKLERWLKKWQRRLRLTDRQIKPKYFEEPKPSDAENEEETYASTRTLSPTLRHDMDVFPNFWEKLEDDVEREQIIVHELLHVVLPDCEDENSIARMTSIIWDAFES